MMVFAAPKTVTAPRGPLAAPRAVTAAATMICNSPPTLTMELLRVYWKRIRDSSSTVRL